MFLCVSWFRSQAIPKGTNLSRINRRFPHDSPLSGIQSFPSSTLIFPHRARPDILCVKRNRLAIKRLTIFRVVDMQTLKMVNYLYHNALRITMICHGRFTF